MRVMIRWKNMLRGGLALGQSLFVNLNCIGQKDSSGYSFIDVSSLIPGSPGLAARVYLPLRRVRRGENQPISKHGHINNGSAGYRLSRGYVLTD